MKYDETTVKKEVLESRECNKECNKWFFDNEELLKSIDTIEKFRAYIDSRPWSHCMTD